MKEQHMTNLFENRTLLSMTIHMVGTLLVGTALGLNAYPYLEAYFGFAIVGLPIVGVSLMLCSLFLRTKS